MKFQILFFNCMLLIFVTFAQEDVPIKDSNNVEPKVSPIVTNFNYCLRNNIHGHINAYRALRNRAILSELESGKNFIYCFMIRFDWLNSSGIFHPDIILRDIENDFRASSGTLSAHTSMDELVHQCTDQFQIEDRDFSISFAIARCLYKTGIQPIPEVMQLLKSKYTVLNDY